MGGSSGTNKKKRINWSRFSIDQSAMKWNMMRTWSECKIDLHLPLNTSNILKLMFTFFLQSHMCSIFCCCKNWRGYLYLFVHKNAYMLLILRRRITTKNIEISDRPKVYARFFVSYKVFFPMMVGVSFFSGVPIPFRRHY